MANWQRICVIGGSGSGKSTLATALGKKYGLPVYHLDRELLHGQFESLPPDETENRHTKLISTDTWVIDGSYNKLLDARLNRAQLIIFLNISRLRTIPRVLRRYKTHELRTGAVPDGAKNSLSLKFIWWCLKYNRRKRFADLKTRCQRHPHVTLVALKNGSVANWLEQIKAL